MLLSRLIVRVCLWLLAHTFYRVEVRGGENLPKSGPALLVCNHISFIDPFLVGAGVRRSICFLMPRRFYEARAVRWLAKRMGACAVATYNLRFGFMVNSGRVLTLMSILESV